MAQHTGACIFDVDGTLLAENIGVTFVRFLLAREECSAAAKALIYLLYPLCKLRLLDWKYAILLGAWAMHGLTPERADILARECFESGIAGRIYADAASEIAACRARGELVILATGAHRAIAVPLAAHLGADRLVALDSEIRGGRYGLRVARPLPYKEGKRDLVATMIRDEFGENGDRPRITVYTDEAKDLPLLALADEPVAVNADPATRDYALAHGGRVVTFA